MIGVTAVCRMCPGPACSTITRPSPSRTLLSPSAAANSSLASTPFCTGMTAVAGPTSGWSDEASPAICVAFTHTSTTSTTPTVAGSSVACTDGKVRSPSMLSRINPRAWSAASVAPRAMNTTSWPACWRRAPSTPPMAPAPTTATRSRSNERAAVSVLLTACRSRNRRCAHRCCDPCGNRPHHRCS